jgi:hypothetical protein
MPYSTVHGGMKLERPFSWLAVGSICGEELGAMLGEMLAGINAFLLCSELFSSGGRLLCRGAFTGTSS